MINEDNAKSTRDFHKKVIERQTFKLLNYYSDAERSKRKNENLCKFCYYYCKDSISGQAVSMSVCENCKQSMVFPTTDTDVLCEDCAKTLHCCKHCGAKMD